MQAIKVCIYIYICMYADTRYTSVHRPCSLADTSTVISSGAGTMQVSPAITGALALSLLLSLFLLPSSTHAHNITRILAKFPEFSTFNHYLTITHLASDINRRQTITVCAVDNAAMSGLLSKNLPLYTIRNVLSLHVFADYFGSKKLHQITKSSTLTATMFQATGEAPGTSGYVNITDLKGGKVGFATEENDGKLTAHYVKSVKEIPYNISVIQISQILTSAAAEAPTPGPSQINLTALMAKQGCKAFSDLVTSSGAEDTFTQNLDGGLTVFCPTDKALNAFTPKYKNLTKSGKVSLLLYHGVPVYQSMQMLKSNNGLMNTLATDGANKYDFTVQNDGEDVTLKTKVVTASVTGTLADVEPLIVYKIDKVLQPTELFKAAAEAADEPAAAPKSKGKKHPDEAPSPDGSDDDDEAADQTTSDNGSGRFSGVWFAPAALSLCLGVLAFF